MNKKGVEAGSFLVGAIITIVSLIVLAPIVVNFTAGDDCKKTEGICESSVSLRALTTIQVDKKNIQSSPLLCKTCDKELKAEKDKIKAEFADMMVRCWKMFGQGRYEEINKETKESFFPDFGPNGCFNCYAATIDATKGFQTGSKITPQELLDYLRDTTYKKAGVSYLEYIQSSGGPGNTIVLTNIEPNKAYGISFAAKNKQPDSTMVAKGIGKIAIGTAVTATGIILIASGVGVAPGIILTGVGASYAGYQSLDVLSAAHNQLFTERYVSTIYVNDLKTTQEKCSQGDIAGK